MIEVFRSESGITIKGHAGYAPEGQDIVCAGVSALTQVFAASIEELTDDNLKCDISAGNAVIRYGNLSERGQVLLDSFLLGIRMISMEYPDYVWIDQALMS